MRSRFHPAARLAAAILILAFSFLLQSATVSAQSTEAPVATAVATDVATTTVTTTPAIGVGGNAKGDVVLVATFTATTVLGLVGLAILDRKPRHTETPDL